MAMHFVAAPFANLPVIDEPWNPDGVSDSELIGAILGPDGDNWAAMKRAHLAFSPGEEHGGDPPTQRNAYKLKVARRDPIRDPSGRLVVVFGQLSSRVAILRGARGGVDIPREAKLGAMRTAKRYYDKIDKEFPGDVTDVASGTPCQCETRGDQLGSALDRWIEAMVTEEMPRAQIIEDMAEAAGISESTVSQILRGEIICPPIERLEGFAEVLGISVNSIVQVAEQDGCDYGSRSIPLMERRQVFGGAIEVIEARDAEEDENKTLKGLASVFYDGTAGTEYELFPGLKERIMPGAFDASLARGDDVRALFNHEPSNILGRTKSKTLSLEVDDKGLRYVINLGNTRIARDVAEHVKRGDITGSSFAFSVEDENWLEEEEGQEIREIVSVTLFDVSPVTFPAYTNSEVSVRVAGDVEPLKALAKKRRQARIEARRASRHRHLRILERRLTI